MKHHAHVAVFTRSYLHVFGPGVASRLPPTHSSAFVLSHSYSCIVRRARARAAAQCSPSYLSRHGEVRRVLYELRSEHAERLTCRALSHACAKSSRSKSALNARRLPLRVDVVRQEL
jgi:hypothetical protein